MEAGQINRLSARTMLVLSLIALLTVLSGYLQPRQPLPTDEGTGAHIFQISVAFLVVVLAAFLCTADWKQPKRNARPLLLPMAVLAAAFVALYCLEHYYLMP